MGSTPAVFGFAVAGPFCRPSVPRLGAAWRFARSRPRSARPEASLFPFVIRGCPLSNNQEPTY
jgi:hypothetical protein